MKVKKPTWDTLHVLLALFCLSGVSFYAYRGTRKIVPPSPHIVDDCPHVTRLTAWTPSPDGRCRAPTEVCLHQFDHGPDLSEDPCVPFDLVTHQLRTGFPSPSLLFHEDALQSHASVQWTGLGRKAFFPSQAEAGSIEDLPVCPPAKR